MKSNSTIEYCILNVAANPHPEGIYLNLLSLAARKEVNFWGDSFATISEPRVVEDGFYQGRVVIWTSIDPNQPGVLLDKLEEIDLRDTAFSMPENLGFNGKIFTYIFRVKDHIMFLECRNEFGKLLSPARAQRLFSGLFSLEILGDSAPMVEVTVVPEEDALSRILSIKSLQSLRIQMLRPNADDIDAEKILEELEEQGARKQEVVIQADPSKDGIKPNDRKKAQMEVASHNGFVIGKGKDEMGESVSYSTKEYPRKIRKVIDEFGSSIAAAVSVAKSTVVKTRDD